jgi:hypothetical protein
MTKKSTASKYERFHSDLRYLQRDPPLPPASQLNICVSYVNILSFMSVCARYLRVGGTVFYLSNF